MRVLIAIDLSAAAGAALAEGVAMASAVGDVYAVLHVVPELPRERPFIPSVDASLESRAEEILAMARSATQARLVGISPGVELFVDEGVDYAVIVQRAESFRADVVVVGAHAELARLHSDVAAKVIRHAHCSVLVARQPTTRGWVLAATDLSEPSLAAVSIAAAEAHRRDAKLKVVHSKGFVDLEMEYLMQITPSIPKRAPGVEPLPEVLRKLLSNLGVEAKFEQLSPPPAVAIVREAEAIGAELIVVGGRSTTGIARFHLGSVAERVVRAAHCSVLVARPRGAAPS